MTILTLKVIDFHKSEEGDFETNPSKSHFFNSFPSKFI